MSFDHANAEYVREWYHAAREVTKQAPHPLQAFKDRETIIEEGSDEEESQASQPISPAADEQPQKAPLDGRSSSENPTTSELPAAAAELRVHEFVALLTCFISPVIGAWLLHYIRAQLSRPSEGLVSNYNLTIFLLASELRPLSHMIKLVQARTLYLQRVVASEPHDSHTSTSPETVADLHQRLSVLETHRMNGSADQTVSAQQQQQETITAVRKAMQSDLDPLNRAVRRYEKRATLTTMQTEARLQDLENRLADAITLAAAAERSSQASKQRRGSGVVMIMDWTSKAIWLPVQLAWATISLPGKFLAGTTQYLEGFIGARLGRELRTAGIGAEQASRGTTSRRATKGPKRK